MLIMGIRSFDLKLVELASKKIFISNFQVRIYASRENTVTPGDDCIFVMDSSLEKKQTGNLGRRSCLHLRRPERIKSCILTVQTVFFIFLF